MLLVTGVQPKQINLHRILNNVPIAKRCYPLILIRQISYLCDILLTSIL